MPSRGVASVLGGGTAGAGFPREASAAELVDWDRLVVQGPGGHVYQSRAWAAQRARLGWQPRHVMLDAEHGALVLLRSFPMIRSASAYIARGPVVDTTDLLDGGEAAARRLAGLTAWLKGRGVVVIASDAEVPAADAAYGRALRSSGWSPIHEIQPSRHRVSIALARDTDDDAVRAGMAKSTRQRIAAAERDEIVVQRYDAAGWPDVAPLFIRPTRPLDAALSGFATVLEQTGDRLGFTFGPRQLFLDWWAAAHRAGLLVYLEANDPKQRDRVLGGLILYRHGGRLSTVHSGDAPGVRDTHPGVMQLLRWRATQLAIREGCAEMDLGGVDVAPDHREPQDGDPMAGLYEHKRSFGATWVEMTGAHELILSSWRYAAGRLTARLARVAGRGRS